MRHVFANERKCALGFTKLYLRVNRKCIPRLLASGGSNCCSYIIKIYLKKKYGVRVLLFHLGSLALGSAVNISLVLGIVKAE
jgi:hypothetical protein